MTRSGQPWTCFSSWRGGDTVAWNYVLVYEDGDWKVDHGEPLAGWQPGRRLGGLQT